MGKKKETKKQLANKPSSDDDMELVVDGAVPCRIPDGIYEATVINVKPTYRYNRQMVDFLFQLATPGYIGQRLPGYAALQANGKPGSRSKLTSWWVFIAELEQLARPERIALRRFKAYRFQVLVGKSKKDGDNKEVPEGRRLSTIQEIIGIVGRVKP